MECSGVVLELSGTKWRGIGRCREKTGGPEVRGTGLLTLSEPPVLTQRLSEDQQEGFPLTRALPSPQLSTELKAV